MLLPGLIFLLVFCYVPMFGIVIAFENFIPALGPFQSPWVGWANFVFMWQDPDTVQIITNTVVIAVSKIILELIVPVTFALLLNELRVSWYKRTAQTLVYLPHFMSWVILGGIILEMFDLNGIVNQLIGLFGFQHIWFFGSNTWFRPLVIGTDVWKEFGFATIIYLAALTGINPDLYEAASIDGAGRLGMLRHITLPGITTTIVLLATLSLQNLLNANFDQVFNLYNPLVYQSGDIIDTWVYRTGLVSQQYGLATAVGLIKSAIGFVMIVTAFKLASRFANYRIF
jgi:putative aldouronate transport system permease protein